MNILITGNAGFIGSNLSEKLLKCGHDVYGIDNFSTGKEINIPKEMIEGKKWFIGDITNINTLRNLFLEIPKQDVIIHLAANASIIKSQSDPTFDMDNNLKSTMNIVKVCDFYKIKRLIYASSMVVYGNGQVPFNEETSIDPNSFYALSKFASERYIKLAAKKYGFDYTFLRMFNVYGPKQDLTNPYQGVVAIFMNNAFKNEPIKIYGDGSQTRDFIYIDDVVEAYAKCLDNDKALNETINIGFGEEFSINYLSEEILSLFENKINKTYDFTKIDSQQRSVADISLAKNLLNWEPKTNFKDGISITKSWYDSNSK